MTTLGSATARLVLTSTLLLVTGCGGDNPAPAAERTPILSSASELIGTLSPASWFGTATPSVKILSDGVPQPVPARKMEEVLAFVYRSVDSSYVERKPLRPLVVAGLAGLSRYDPKFAAQDQDGSLRLFYDGKPIAQLDPPVHSENPNGWSRVAETGAALAESVSPALRGVSTDDMLSALFTPALQTLDPYTRYLTPAQAREEQAGRRGFGGIGVTLDTETIGLIRTVLKDTPAEASGFQPGDRIVMVNDVPVSTLTQAQLVALLRGDVGSRVALTLQRPDQPPIARSVARAKIFQATVRAERDENGVLTIKLTSFNNGTVDTFKAEVEAAARQQPLKGIVLDLRDNPGGVFGAAIDIADFFLTDGVIMTVQGRTRIINEYSATTGNEVVPARVPLVLLMNGQSASASEVLAAALQDHGRAVVVGSGSFGKGLVQNVYENLPGEQGNRPELIMTTTRLHSPLGYSLHKYGVIPTVCTARQADTPATIDQIVAEIRRADFHPEEVLTARRTADRSTEAARATLSGLCPPSKAMRTVDIDRRVAEALLADPALYARALPASMLARKN